MWVAGWTSTVVVLPEDMSQERFDLIESYGARIIKTPGCESNVKEIYDKCWELVHSDSQVRVLNQFEVMGNYRFHYYVTGNTLVELAANWPRRASAGARFRPSPRLWDRQEPSPPATG